MWFRKRIVFAGVFLVTVVSWPMGVFAQAGYPFGDRDRDPFMPLVSKSGQLLLTQEIDATGLRLQGIIYSSGKSVAIINDQVLREGGVVGEYAITKIDQKQVTLQKGSEEFILKLEEA